MSVYSYLVYVIPHSCMFNLHSMYLLNVPETAAIYTPSLTCAYEFCLIPTNHVEKCQI